MSTGTVAELKAALQDRLTTIEQGMESGVKIDGANVEMSQDTADTMRNAMDEATDIRTALEAKMLAESGREFMDAPTRQAIAPGVAGTMQHKSLGQMFTDSPEFKSLMDSRDTTMRSPFEIEAFNLPAMMGRKDVYEGMISGDITRGLGPVQFDAPVPRGQRALRVRDLFPQVSTSASLIDYFRVMGYSGGDPGSAAAVEERSGGTFAAKPQSSLTFEDAQAPVRTIAHWEAAHRNVLDDVPALQGIINNELLYGLALEEDRQLLLGSGNGGEILGLLKTSGIQTYTSPNELKSDSLRRAATKAIIANYPPTGYVMNPYDWEDIELQRPESGGDGQYMVTTNVAIGASAQIWRQPVVETPALPEGEFLVGAFGLGAQVYDRQQANVRIAEQHSDFFVKNAVAVLAEERIALAVKRPESFVKGVFYGSVNS